MFGMNFKAVNYERERTLLSCSLISALASASVFVICCCTPGWGTGIVLWLRSKRWHTASQRMDSVITSKVLFSCLQSTAETFAQLLQTEPCKCVIQRTQYMWAQSRLCVPRHAPSQTWQRAMSQLEWLTPLSSICMFWQSFWLFHFPVEASTHLDLHFTLTRDGICIWSSFFHNIAGCLGLPWSFSKGHVRA